MTIQLGTPELTRVVLDVPVEEGPVPEPWDAAVVVEPWWCADADRIRFAAHGAVVYVEPGRVLLSAPDPATRASADWLLYATATRALLTFRGDFNLHASLVVSPTGAAVALVGDSGAGKSTTTLQLLQRGWSLAGDDIVAVRPGPDGAIAHPVDRPIHLSDAAARAIGADPAVGRLLPSTGKRAYRLDADLGPRPLAAVVVLSRQAQDGQVALRRVDGLAAVPTIALSADRYRICRLPEHRAAFLDWTVSVCRQVSIWDLRRPPVGDTVAAVVDAVEKLSSEVG
ncbi:HPr kinase/phosphatase C-terminal domain-containing protein [Nocardioides maradonensis]